MEEIEQRNKALRKVEEAEDILNDIDAPIQRARVTKLRIRMADELMDEIIEGILEDVKDD